MHASPILWLVVGFVLAVAWFIVYGWKKEALRIAADPNALTIGATMIGKALPFVRGIAVTWDPDGTAELHAPPIGYRAWGGLIHEVRSDLNRDYCGRVPPDEQIDAEFLDQPPGDTGDSP